MKIDVVTYHLPHPDGTATGRHVFAIWEAVRAMGHDVSAWCWGRVPDDLEPPSWVKVSHFHDPGGWRRKPATILRPRGGLASVGWEPSPDAAVAWAEEPESYAAVSAAERRGVTIYHSEVLDAIALRRPRPEVVQSVRAERHVVRRAGVAITFSPRVARVTGVKNLCPVTLPIPPEPLEVVEEPVAVMIADWAWRPNQAALRRLLDHWSMVREEVAGAKLLIAGRGLTEPIVADGVEVMGEVAQARDALSRAAVLAFPCPPTSGPKMKVLDALAWGLPVVTTVAGVEGIKLGEGTVAIADDDRFFATLVEVLKDPQRRALMAKAGRADVLAGHRPDQAAEARLKLINQL
ncbi:MAG TPA: glycosyltransferase family 4 protein [Mycobacteriales bacterium]|nr:glycosyltransferase family 4 protein [Mycobacteriales bacterium]